MKVSLDKIGKFLVDKNYISRFQLESALTEQKETGRKLGTILVNKGFLTQREFLKILSEKLGIPYIDLNTYTVDPDVLNLLTEKDARRLGAIVINHNDNGFLVGMTDPSDIMVTDELEKILQGVVNPAIIAETEFERFLDINYSQNAEISNLSQELYTVMEDLSFDIPNLSEGLTVSDAPVVKLLQSIFEDASKLGASDVHIEPDEKVLRIRKRVDGVLVEQTIDEKQIADALAVRLKLMSGLNIAEKRAPQDGRFAITVRDKKYDIRLSSLPSQYGESIVMRLLDQSSTMLSLEDMGMPPNILEKVRKIMGLAHGLLLITGPTGSGKSTSLYAMLAELNEPQVKIITVEDPVEYSLERITEVQANAAIGFTFAKALRSILRQDPDIIMIGELRDQETAEIALRAAMTGHFVFSTLHTNTAASTPERLIDMGIDPFLVASVLSGVIAQRLIKRICENCKEEYKLTPQDKAFISAYSNDEMLKQKYMHGAGCSFCFNSGYKGRASVYELLVINEELSLALTKNDRDQFMKILNDDKEYKSLAMNGLDLAAKGVTTIAEIMGIVGGTINE